MRFVATIEYFGLNYSGWQFQKNAVSVQETLQNQLSILLQEPIVLVASGRTDKGVHALGQVAHFDSNTVIPPAKITLAVNTMLPKDVRILNIDYTTSDFHAQYCAKRKTYIYKFYVSSILRPTRELTHAQIIPPIDFDIMQLASKKLVGEHDFVAFSATGSHIINTVRELFRVDLSQNKDEITLEVEGNGFLYNMIRIIAGTLVYIAKGKIPITAIDEMFASGDRKLGGKTFPPNGLYLKEVNYNAELTK